MFNRWQDRIEGARLLDLFCGSGSVGIEALSRGASSSAFVDSRRPALEMARRNLSKLGGSRAARSSALFLRSTADVRGFRPRLDRLGSFDLVFADPPYGFEVGSALLAEVALRMESGGSLVLEHSSRIDPPGSQPRLARLDQRAYGDSTLTWYQSEAPDAGNGSLAHSAGGK